MTRVDVLMHQCVGTLVLVTVLMTRVDVLMYLCVDALVFCVLIC
jgi:hypothetical protein